MANPQHGHAAAPASQTPKPHDPANDIDGRATFLWVGSWALVFFASMWIMLVIFDRVLFEERTRKVESLPTTEIETLLKSEHEYLAGKQKDGPKKPIEQVMQEMVKK